MNKPYFIVVEGAQGVGKSSLTNGLRESIPYTTLLRLSGTKESSAEHAFINHKSILNMVKDNAGLGMNFVCDRSYFSEEVYCKLGYKKHSFDKECADLTASLATLVDHYNIIFLLLTAGGFDLGERLRREKVQCREVIFDVD